MKNEDITLLMGAATISLVILAMIFTVSGQALTHEDCRFYAEKLGQGTYYYRGYFKSNKCIVDGHVITHDNFEQQLNDYATKK
jgi:hypothetical protein